MPKVSTALKIHALAHDGLASVPNGNCFSHSLRMPWLTVLAAAYILPLSVVEADRRISGAMIIGWKLASVSTSLAIQTKYFAVIDQGALSVKCSYPIYAALRIRSALVLCTPYNMTPAKDNDAMARTISSGIFESHKPSYTKVKASNRPSASQPHQWRATSPSSTSQHRPPPLKHITPIMSPLRFATLRLQLHSSALLYTKDNG